MKKNNGKRPPKKGSAKIREIMENLNKPEDEYDGPERSREILRIIRERQNAGMPVPDAYYQELELDPEDCFCTSHEFFLIMEQEILFEQDIKMVKERALYYMSKMCEIMSDNVSTELNRRIREDGAITD